MNLFSASPEPGRILAFLTRYPVFTHTALKAIQSDSDYNKESAKARDVLINAALYYAQDDGSQRTTQSQPARKTKAKSDVRPPVFHTLNSFWIRVNPHHGRLRRGTNHVFFGSPLWQQYLADGRQRTLTVSRLQETLDTTELETAFPKATTLEFWLLLTACRCVRKLPPYLKKHPVDGSPLDKVRGSPLAQALRLDSLQYLRGLRQGAGESPASTAAQSLSWDEFWHQVDHILRLTEERYTALLKEPGKKGEAPLTADDLSSLYQQFVQKNLSQHQAKWHAADPPSVPPRVEQAEP